jgi:hypothetical protein
MNNTNYQMNAIDTPIEENSKSFKDILEFIRKKVETNKVKIKYLRNLDEYKLTTYLKTQEGFKFHKKSSYFLEDVVEKVTKKLEKKIRKDYLEYLSSDEDEDEDEDEDDYYVPYLDDNCPQWLKDITSETFTESQKFIVDYKLCVTRVKVHLFGPDTKYWIFIVGSDDLDLGPDFNEQGDIIEGNKEKCYEWWYKNILGKYFKSKDQMQSELGVMICSENFISTIIEENGKSIFFYPNIIDGDNLSSIFSNLKV